MKKHQKKALQEGNRRMIMIKVMLFFMIFMAISPLVSAQTEHLGIFKQNDCVYLLQTCASCTYNVITSVTYPNSSQAIGQRSMTQLNTQFNYTFCNTSTLGTYIVNGFGDLDGTDTIWNYDFLITSTGKQFNGMDVAVYILFLLICLTITFFSIRLIKKNPMAKDEMKKSDLYEMKKAHEFKFYLELLKKKMWILGVFGIYLSVLVFLSYFNQLMFSLGITEFGQILTYAVEILGWGLIPFITFWLVYVIIFLYKSTTEIFKYQFGKDTWRGA